MELVKKKRKEFQMNLLQRQQLEPHMCEDKDFQLKTDQSIARW